jgi:collagen type V/XI/XXIV/XXVII alpha
MHPPHSALREGASAARHLERLQSARQSGMYKPGSLAGLLGSPAAPSAAAAAGGGGGGHSSGSPGTGPLGHIVSKVAAAIGSHRAPSSGGGGGGGGGAAASSRWGCAARVKPHAAGAQPRCLIAR